MRAVETTEDLVRKVLELAGQALTAKHPKEYWATISAVGLTSGMSVYIFKSCDAECPIAMAHAFIGEYMAEKDTCENLKKEIELLENFLKECGV